MEMKEEGEGEDLSQGTDADLDSLCEPNFNPDRFSKKKLENANHRTITFYLVRFGPIISFM